MKAVFMQYFALILRFIDIGKIDVLRLTVLSDQFFSLSNVFFLSLTAEPLVDLIFCLCTLYDI